MAGRVPARDGCQLAAARRRDVARRVGGGGRASRVRDHDGGGPHRRARSLVSRLGRRARRQLSERGRAGHSPGDCPVKRRLEPRQGNRPATHLLLLSWWDGVTLTSGVTGRFGVHAFLVPSTSPSRQRKKLQWSKLGRCSPEWYRTPFMMQSAWRRLWPAVSCLNCRNRIASAPTAKRLPAIAPTRSAVVHLGRRDIWSSYTAGASCRIGRRSSGTCCPAWCPSVKMCKRPAVKAVWTWLPLAVASALAAILTWVFPESIRRRSPGVREKGHHGSGTTARGLHFVRAGKVPKAGTLVPHLNAALPAARPSATGQCAPFRRWRVRAQRSCSGSRRDSRDSE